MSCASLTQVPEIKVRPGVERETVKKQPIVRLFENASVDQFSLWPVRSRLSCVSQALA